MTHFCLIIHFIKATVKWLDVNPPTKKEWIMIVKNMYDMENLTFSLRLNMDKFYKYWSKWITYRSVDGT